MNFQKKRTPPLPPPFMTKLAVLTAITHVVDECLLCPRLGCLSTSPDLTLLNTRHCWGHWRCIKTDQLMVHLGPPFQLEETSKYFRDHAMLCRTQGMNGGEQEGLFPRGWSTKAWPGACQMTREELRGSIPREGATSARGSEQDAGWCVES